MDLIILAGGSGTRIQSISQGIPKSLLPIGKVVFIDKILSNVNRYDISHIYLSLYYKPELFKEYLEHNNYQENITPLVESELMGTGGAIKYITENTSISDPFFVLNGDTLSNTNLNVVSITPPAAEEEPEIEELEDEEGEMEGEMEGEEGAEGEEGDKGAVAGQEGGPKDRSEKQSGES